MRSPALQSNLPSLLPCIQCIGPGIVALVTMCTDQTSLSQVTVMLPVYRCVAESSADRLRPFQLCMLQLASKVLQLVNTVQLNLNQFVVLTFPFVTNKAFTGVNLIVRPLRQLLSFGWVNSNLPSIAKRTSSWCHSSRSIAIFRSFMLIMSISHDDRRFGLDDEIRRHNFVGTSLASRFMWLRCSSIFSCACFSSSRPSRCWGVTLYRRARSSGYFVTRWTGTCERQFKCKSRGRNEQCI